MSFVMLFSTSILMVQHRLVYNYLIESFLKIFYLLLYMVKVKYKNKEYNIPQKYLGNLKGKELQKQIKSIVEGTKRPETSAKPRRSSFVVAFEKKYGTKITDRDFIHKNIITNTGIDKILSKGRGAYYSGGSRPNQTPSSWAYGRLASVIMNGKARQVDIDIWRKYKRK